MEERGIDDDSETEQITDEDAMHQCYICGGCAGGDEIQLDCSDFRPWTAQAYYCADRVGCVERAEERVSVLEAELEFARGRLALAEQKQYK